MFHFDTAGLFQPVLNTPLCTEIHQTIDSLSSFGLSTFENIILPCFRFLIQIFHQTLLLNTNLKTPCLTNHCILKGKSTLLLNRDVLQSAVKCWDTATRTWLQCNYWDCCSVEKIIWDKFTAMAKTISAIFFFFFVSDVFISQISHLMFFVLGLAWVLEMVAPLNLLPWHLDIWCGGKTGSSPSHQGKTVLQQNSLCHT